MKSLLFLFLLFPLALLAQDDNQEVRLSKNVQDSIPGTALVLKDYTTIFEKIYSSDLEKEELAAEIKMYLPAVKNFQLTSTENQSVYQLSGRLTDYIAIYTRFDSKAYYDSFPLNAPIDANVLISIKDKKYRVIVSEIVFQDATTDAKGNLIDQPLNVYFSTLYKPKFRLGGEAKKVADFLSKDLVASFDINNHNKISIDF
ncbi:hypothetical protein [Pedobacter sp. NJ-S-72]